MTRPQLEHIIRAAAAITGTDQFVVIRSQAILGAHPDAPAELRNSQELDIFSLQAPRDSELIDGSIGEESPFHRTFGYFAHGVGEETALLPAGWRERLVPVRTAATGGATALCLDTDDLGASKLAAGRDKDSEFVAAMLRYGLTTKERLTMRVRAMPIDQQRMDQVLARLGRLSPGA